MSTDSSRSGRQAWHDRMVKAKLDVLLLLALPASGKSEVRRYIDHVDTEIARRDLALGPTVQLDDYPYVHLMRRISQTFRGFEEDPVFFAADETPFLEPLDWLTLIHLINGDYAQMMSGGSDGITASNLLDRFDRARLLSGAPPLFGGVSSQLRADVEASIAEDVARLDPIPAADNDSTVIIEFARGGPVDTGFPFPHPLGYESSIAALSEEIQSKASILYVSVDPDESRRRNRDRAVPGRDGEASILHHGVPEVVMAENYGADDMGWLHDQARVPGTIPVGPLDIPMERFDNRTDRTSFLRADPSAWSPEMVKTLHHDLSGALLRLARPPTA